MSCIPENSGRQRDLEHLAKDVQRKSDDYDGRDMDTAGCYLKDLHEGHDDYANQ